MTERFPPPVAEVLIGAGWRPGHRDDDRSRDWALRIAGYAAPDGRQHVVVPAAIEAYAEFGDLLVRPDGDGEQVAPSVVHLNPFPAVHSVATLAGLAGVLGAALTPLGVEGDGTGILAMDAIGRVFVLDHGGDWFLGATLDEALAVLVLGTQPPRISQDGAW